VLAEPAIYQRLREEVRALGPDPDPERLAALPYLDATVKEVLRMRPVVPIVGRVLQRPFRVGGHDLPAGTRVGACIYLTHRDPDVYPEPHVFRPERFLGVQPDASSWLPFGGGIRRCIGAAFALYELKVVMGTMLAMCDLELAQDAPSRIVRRAVTFFPEGGARIRFRKLAA
jgi:cytochrome P450 family 110